MGSALGQANRPKISSAVCKYLNLRSRKIRSAVARKQVFLSKGKKIRSERKRAAHLRSLTLNPANNSIQ
jgi:hypothetical protein